MEALQPRPIRDGTSQALGRVSCKIAMQLQVTCDCTPWPHGRVGCEGGSLRPTCDSAGLCRLAARVADNSALIGVHPTLCAAALAELLGHALVHADGKHPVTSLQCK